jgi:hypothetical protein
MAVIAEIFIFAFLLFTLEAHSSGVKKGEYKYVALESLNLSRNLLAFDANAGPWPDNNGRWYSYRQSDDLCVNGWGFSDNTLSPASCFVWLTSKTSHKGQWVGSQGPWWVDPNHMKIAGGNGFGLIHVLAFTQLPGAWQGPLDLDRTTVRLRARISSDWLRPVAPSRFGDKEGRAYLWFQTYPRPVANCIIVPEIGENCTRQSNYIFTDGFNPAVALDQNSEEHGRAFAIPLRANEKNRWTCLGAGRNVKYDCMPFEDAVKQVAIMGVIFGPVRSCPLPVGAPASATCDREILSANPTTWFNHGRFELRDFSISFDEDRKTTAVLSAMHPSQHIKPAKLWNPIRLLKIPALESGQGVHLVVTKNMQAVRIGLSKTKTLAGFDDAGPMAYISPAGGEP